MSVKEARFNDHWREVYRREYHTKVLELAYRKFLCLTDGNVECSGGISAIVGPNGVGKATVIAAIAELMETESSPIEITLRNRVNRSELAGSLLVNDAEVTLRVESGPDGERRRVGDEFRGEFRFLDPSDLGMKHLKQIHADAECSELLESVGVVQLDENERNTVVYLVGKTYESVSLYEIADYAGFDRFL